MNLERKWLSFCLIIACAFVNKVVAENSFIIDQTKAVIYDPAGTKIISLMDTEKASISNEIRTAEQLLFEFLVFLRAQTLHINFPDEIIEKAMEDMQKNNGWTFEQFEMVLKSTGYTLAQFREELRRYHVVNQMLDFQVYSKAIVTQESIANFFNEHPEIQETRYYIEICYPRTKNAKKTTKYSADQWDCQDPFWIKQSEIAEDKLFITTMAVGEDYVTDDNIIYRLVTKEAEQITPLETRYQDIVRILKEPTTKKLLESYKETVLKEGNYVIF
jgi:SurA N-terminal domain